MLLGWPKRSLFLFAYRTITVCGQPFQVVRLKNSFVTSLSGLRSGRLSSRYSDGTRPAGFSIPSVWAVPRSLAATWGITSFSLPEGTEMFHFPSLASILLCIHRKDDRVLPRPGYPIRKSTDLSLLAAPRGLSQLATPFIAFWCPGIHRVPLVT